MTPPLDRTLPWAAAPMADAPALHAGLFLDLAGVLLDATPAPGARAGLRGGVGAALRLLDRLDYRIVVLAPCGLDRRQAAHQLPARIADLLAREQVVLAGCYRCEAKGAPCLACPPAPAMLVRAARNHGIHLAASWLLAHDARFLAAGQQAGCRTVMVAADGEDAWPAPLTLPDAGARPAAYQARDIVDAALAILRLDGSGTAYLAASRRHAPLPYFPNLSKTS